MKFTQTIQLYIQKYGIEIFNTIGGGILGFISSKIFQDWIQPILVTFICAVISLLVSYYGKKYLESRDKRRAQ